MPAVLITLQRQANSYGYFSPNRFARRSSQNSSVGELALNPDRFTGASDEEICSRLVHEMAHVWQDAHGRWKPQNGGYHNSEWAIKMQQIGLHPSSTGRPGGKETGQHMSHYIVPAGPYAQAYTRLAATGFRLNWESSSPPAKKKGGSKVKYSCPRCGANTWAKPEANLVCGDCQERML